MDKIEPTTRDEIQAEINEQEKACKTLAFIMSQCYSDDAYRNYAENQRTRRARIRVLEDRLKTLASTPSTDGGTP